MNDIGPRELPSAVRRAARPGGTMAPPPRWWRRPRQWPAGAGRRPGTSGGPEPPTAPASDQPAGQSVGGRSATQRHRCRYRHRRTGRVLDMQRRSQSAI